MREISIEGEFIKLDQFLKLTSLVQTGGQAKIVIQDGMIYVNGEKCLQRGRKLKSGDTIEIEASDEKFIIK